LRHFGTPCGNPEKASIFSFFGMLPNATTNRSNRFFNEYIVGHLSVPDSSFFELFVATLDNNRENTLEDCPFSHFRSQQKLRQNLVPEFSRTKHVHKGTQNGPKEFQKAELKRRKTKGNHKKEKCGSISPSNVGTGSACLRGSSSAMLIVSVFFLALTHMDFHNV
jgi:hypothetical protein